VTIARDAPAASRALTVEIDQGIGIITFDLPNEPVNKFSRAVKDEFGTVLDRLDRNPSCKAIVLLSGKPDIFIAGADIDEFLGIETPADAERLSREGQFMLQRLEELRPPVVAAIHGACLGGGLEAALACAYRIATDHPKTVLALPEVQLGLIPGAGGTQRLPRIVGVRAALDMILTGKNVRAKKALSLSLIDELVHPAILRDVAIDRARQLGDGKIRRRRPRRNHGAGDLLLEDNPLGRRVVFRQAREQTIAKSKGHYPAPLAAIDAVATGCERGAAQGYATEARLFGAMAATEVSRQLIFLFFASNSLKKDTGVESPIQPLPVEKIGVLGAGFMGAGIAALAAQQDTVVRLKDADLPRVGKGLRAVSEQLRERFVRRQITRRELEDQTILVGGTVDYSGFGNMDLVVEAVFEDLDLKRQVLREAEEVIPGDAIYATNTSTIPISRIAEASKRPEQVLGMHFFSPVQKMPLVEVIRGGRTGETAIATTVAFGKKLGKTVIVVDDGPGFYVNRILTPYINEAGRLLDEGVAIDAVDAAMVDFGFPVGPITLIDEVGLDVAGKSGRVMHEAFGERMAPSESIRRVIDAGRLGRKGKSGFYRYDESGRKMGVDESVYELIPGGMQRQERTVEEIQRRCVFAMINEAARCLGEGIISCPRDGDVGAVFGIGFPPFRGGPFRYLEAIGIEHATRTLDSLHDRFAPRYEPGELLRELARTGDRFYPSRGNPFR